MLAAGALVWWLKEGKEISKRFICKFSLFDILTFSDVVVLLWLRGEQISQLFFFHSHFFTFTFCCCHFHLFTFTFQKSKTNVARGHTDIKAFTFSPNFSLKFFQFHLFLPFYFLFSLLSCCWQQHGLWSDAWRRGNKCPGFYHFIISLLAKFWLRYFVKCGN